MRPNIGLSIARLSSATLIVALGLLVSAPATRAGDGGLGATAYPGSVSLPPGGSASGVLVIANDPGSVATIVKVEVGVSDASVHAKVARAPTTIPKGASLPLSFMLERVSEGSGQDVSVRFVVTYRQTTAAGGTPSRTVVAEATVKAVKSPGLLEATFQSKVETIDEVRPGEAALVISNPRETKLRVDSLQVTAPAQVRVTLTCPNNTPLAVAGGKTTTFSSCPLDVPPRSEAILRATFNPADAVTPGPRVVLITINGSEPDTATTQSVVATTSFTVDVFAEAEILKSVGVPVFLLLPGVLIVVISWFLISKLSPWRRAASNVPLGNVVSAATIAAIVGLCVSLLIAALYPTLTDLYPGTRRDYREAYGFVDFYYVIGYSFAISIVVWFSVSLVGFVLVPVGRWLFIPLGTDNAQAVLRKLGVRGLVGGDTRFPRVTVAWTDTTNTESKPTAFLLHARGKNMTLMPGLSVVPREDAGKDTEEITRHAANGHAFRLWRTVCAAVDDQTVDLSYRENDIARPELAAPDRVAYLDQVTPVLEVTPAP